MKKLFYFLIFISTIFLFNLKVNAYTFNDFVTYCISDSQVIGKNAYSKYSLTCGDLKQILNHKKEQYPSYNLDTYHYLNISISNVNSATFFGEMSYTGASLNGDGTLVILSKKYWFNDTGSTTIKNSNFTYNGLYNMNVRFESGTYKPNIEYSYINGNSYLIDLTTSYFVPPTKYNVYIHNNINDDIITKENTANTPIYNSAVGSEPPNYEGYEYIGAYSDSNYEHELDWNSIVTSDTDIYFKYSLINSFEFVDLDEYDYYSFDTNYDYLIISFKDTNPHYFGTEIFSNSFNLHYYQDDILTDVCTSPSYHFSNYYFYDITSNNSIFVVAKSQLYKCYTSDLDLRNCVKFNNTCLEPTHSDTCDFYGGFYLTKNAIVSYTNDLSNVTIPVYNEDIDDYEDIDFDISDRQAISVDPIDVTNNENLYFRRLTQNIPFLRVFYFIGDSINIIYYSFTPLIQSYFFYLFMFGILLIILKVLL